MNTSFYNREVVTALPTDSLEQVAVAMQKHNVGAVVIVAQQRPVGIVTDRDVALAIGARRVSLSTPAQEVMTCPVATLSENEGIFQAAKRIRETAARRMPVVDQVGRLVGVISADDLILLLGRELNNVAQGIRPEMATSV